MADRESVVEIEITPEKIENAMGVSVAPSSQAVGVVSFVVGVLGSRFLTSRPDGMVRNIPERTANRTSCIFL